MINLLNAELNPICHLLALLGAHHIFHVSRVRVIYTFEEMLNTKSANIKQGHYLRLVGKAERKRPLGDPGVDGRIILRWIFRKWDVGWWTGPSWLRIGTGGRHLRMR